MIPAGVRILILNFFIPMQIVLLIEILPLIAKIIEAMGIEKIGTHPVTITTHATSGTIRGLTHNNKIV